MDFLSKAHRKTKSQDRIDSDMKKKLTTGKRQLKTMTVDNLNETFTDESYLSCSVPEIFKEGVINEMFSQGVITAGVSKLGKLSIIFVEQEVKIKSHFYHDRVLRVSLEGLRDCKMEIFSRRCMCSCNKTKIGKS